MSNLRWINLNLLPILRELLRHRNVTRAAETLNMSQSAVSEALGRLRDLCGDELLATRGRQFEKTSFAERLGPDLEIALDVIDRLFAKSSFDPAEAEGTIRIATADYIMMVLARNGLADIHAAAPRLRVAASDASPSSIDDLRSGHVDFIIAPNIVSPVPWGELRADLLFEDDQVCVVSKDANISSPMTAAEFESLPHAIFRPTASDAILDTADAVVLRQAGLRRREVVEVPNFLLLPFVAATLGGIAICPRNVADAVGSSANVRIVEPPVPFPRVHLMIISARMSRTDAAKTWFHDRLLASCASLRSS